MVREVFTSPTDGKEISVVVWEEVTSPKAVVQIAHGMAEHIARYDEFARHLNEKGYIVFGDDHRAHGYTDKDALGLAGKGDLFADTVSDLIALTTWAKERWALPVVLLGHSYGSFLAQSYLVEDSGNVAACVLSGSALHGGLIASFGGMVANRKCKKNADGAGDFFAKITFESYDKKVGEGKNAWLSRDAASNEKYNADELSGFTCSNGFYKWFFAGLKRNIKSDYVSVRADLPLLVVYGKNDHVSNQGKLINGLVKKYKKAGLNPKVIGYENARHEILNETNRQEVFADIVEFLETATAG